MRITQSRRKKIKLESVTSQYIIILKWKCEENSIRFVKLTNLS